MSYVMLRAQYSCRGKRSSGESGLLPEGVNGWDPVPFLVLIS